MSIKVNLCTHLWLRQSSFLFGIMTFGDLVKPYLIIFGYVGLVLIYDHTLDSFFSFSAVFIEDYSLIEYISVKSDKTLLK